MNNSKGQVAVEYVLMVMVVASMVIFLFKKFQVYIYAEECADTPQAMNCQLQNVFIGNESNKFKRYRL